MNFLCNLVLHDFSTSGPQPKLFEGINKTLDLTIYFLVLLTQKFNLIYGMQHRGVMLIAEFPTNLRQ